MLCALYFVLCAFYHTFGRIDFVNDDIASLTVADVQHLLNTNGIGQLPSHFCVQATNSEGKMVWMSCTRKDGGTYNNAHQRNTTRAMFGSFSAQSVPETNIFWVSTCCVRPGKETIRVYLGELTPAEEASTKLDVTKASGSGIGFGFGCGFGVGITGRAASRWYCVFLQC